MYLNMYLNLYQILFRLKMEIIHAKAMVTIAMGGELEAQQVCKRRRRPPAPSEATELAALRRRRRRRHGSFHLSKAQDVNVNNNDGARNKSATRMPL